MSACPCCGAAASLELTVDLNTNTLIHKQSYQHTTRQRAEFLHILVKRYPGTVSYDSLIRGLWGVTEPEVPKQTIKVLAHECRKLLHKIGFDIHCVVGFGLRIEPIREAQRAA